MLERLRKALRRISPPAPARQRQMPADGVVAPVTRRVISIIHNPVVDRRTGRTLVEHYGWYAPHDLERRYIADVARASYGLLRYEVVERIEKDGFVELLDGFCYDVRSYLHCWDTRAPFHQPEGTDYHAILREFEIVERIDAGQVDEVWLFAYPGSGYYESIMAGPDAFWCNAPPLPREGQRHRLPRCSRRFVVMGFNYERDVDCMLEDLGHRAESMMSAVYAGRRGAANLWDHFSRYDQVAPGRASVGNVHFAPNSEYDYDWGNRRAVLSDCDDWLRYPHLTGERRLVDCRDWGNGDMRLHHLWWFERLPHAPGETGGILNNWWTYVADPNWVR